MRRVYAVYRNDAGDSAQAAFDGNAEMAIYPDGSTRSMDVTFDTYDADTGELVRRGITPREELDK